MNTVSAQLIASKPVKLFLATLSTSDQNKVLHELSLIADGQSLEFAPVHNPVIVEWCKTHGLGEPKRFKLMCIAPQKGGIRLIFAFTLEQNPRLMYVLRAGYRDENIYGDGR
jgi:hypothetical protein